MTDYSNRPVGFMSCSQLLAAYESMLGAPVVRPRVAYVHPLTLLLMRIEGCETTYERRCTMRGYVAYLRRCVAVGANTPHVFPNWPEFAKMHGVRA